MSKTMYFFLGGVVVLFLIVAIMGMARSSDDSETFDTSHNTKATSSMSSFIKEDLNEKYGVITLSSSTKGKLAEYSLTRNTDNCIVHCEAEGKVTLYQDGVIFEDVMFKTLTGQPTSIKSSEYLLFDGYKDNYVDVPDQFKEICVELPTNTTSNGVNCHQEIFTYKKENQPIEIWKPYNKEVLKAGDYRWKIKGTKELMQSVDFIPVVKSNEFSEWATWNASMNVGLIAYFTMNETTGSTMYDSLGINNLTVNASQWRGGIIAGGWNDGDASALGTLTTGFTDAITYNVWINSTTTGTTYWGGDGTNNGSCVFSMYKDSASQTYGLNYYDWGAGTALPNTNGAYILNKFVMITVTINTTGQQLFVNGTLKATGTKACVAGAMRSPATIFAHAGNPTSLGNAYDEFGVWNRTLTPAEVTDLYNGGAGMTYTTTFPVTLNITGKVVTSSGANVPNATIVILNSTGQWIANTTSNESGDWRYSFTNGTIKNYTIVGYNPNNVSQGGNAYPFFNA
jgi:hypothetical protein